MEPTFIKHDVRKYENGAMHYVRTDNYAFVPVGNNTLVLERNGVKKLIKVVPSYEFVYKVLKTQINARGGAEGLATFLSDPEWHDTAVKLMDTMMDTVKAKKLHPWE